MTIPNVILSVLLNGSSNYFQIACFGVLWAIICVSSVIRV